MRIIVPMAGIGKRMRPHTLTIPKPLLPIAGKPIVHRLVEDITKTCHEPVEEIAFIIKESFGKDVETNLEKVAHDLGARCRICYQEEALGTAHAILCAREALAGEVIVAFADTLFKADFQLDKSHDSIIWVQKVEDPSAFGVVEMKNNEIINFVEKPVKFVSDLAIIGIYYFKDGENLKRELQFLMDNEITDKGEYQLTDALKNMLDKGMSFGTGQVSEWLDCGNKEATVYTNQRYLEYIGDQIHESARLEHTLILSPVHIGEGVEISHSVIGPHVSIGKNCNVQQSIIKNTIIQEETKIKKALLENSMLGNHVHYEGQADDVSLGDYNIIKSNSC